MPPFSFLNPQVHFKHIIADTQGKKGGIGNDGQEFSHLYNLIPKTDTRKEALERMIGPQTHQHATLRSSDPKS